MVMPLRSGKHGSIGGKLAAPVYVCWCAWSSTYVLHGPTSHKRGRQCRRGGNGAGHRWRAVGRPRATARDTRARAAPFPDISTPNAPAESELPPRPWQPAQIPAQIVGLSPLAWPDNRHSGSSVRGWMRRRGEPVAVLARLQLISLIAG